MSGSRPKNRAAITKPGRAVPTLLIWRGLMFQLLNLQAHNTKVIKDRIPLLPSSKLLLIPELLADFLRKLLT